MRGHWTPRLFAEGVDVGRLRIPAQFAVRDGEETELEGAFPVIPNGLEVSRHTPMVALKGLYRATRADCGLGCRCDMTISPVTP